MSTRAPLEAAILISGRGSNMMAIARECLAGHIAARVAVVISDRADAPGLSGARELGLETAVLKSAESAGGPALEVSLAAVLEAHGCDVIALAGFMRILSGPFVARHLGRMFNIHPSLLPGYRGLHTHRRVLEAHDTEHGASVHFVTARLDAGPVVLQSRVAVMPGDTEATLSARVHATEHIIYPRVLGWFAERRLVWRDGAPWLDGQRLDTPIVEDFRATARSCREPPQAVRPCAPRKARRTGAGRRALGAAHERNRGRRRAPALRGELHVGLARHDGGGVAPQARKNRRHLDVQLEERAARPRPAALGAP